MENEPFDIPVSWFYAGLWVRRENRESVEKYVLKSQELLGSRIQIIKWFDSPALALEFVNREYRLSYSKYFEYTIKRFFILDAQIAKKRKRRRIWGEIYDLTYFTPNSFTPWNRLIQIRKAPAITDFVLAILNYLMIYDSLISYNGYDRELRIVESLIDLTRSCSFWLPFGETIIIADAPASVCWLDGTLHKDGGPAISYQDDSHEWFLNGIRVPRKIAETPAHELNPALILTEKNADIRREIVRKIGIERVCEKLGAKCIDSEENYELLLLDLQDGRKRPYLKMINPSIGVYHIEGVAPHIKTVKAALSWRNGTTERPVKIT
jgi:hypothetical protein